jgi:adenylate cyclase
MSEFTNQEVTSHFITREIDTVAVKGKVDGIKIFELIAAKDDADFEALSYITACPPELEKYPTRCSRLPGPSKLVPHLTKFDAALALYRGQKFDEAIAAFEDLVAACDDPVSKVFIGRCHEFKEDPPEVDWDGVYRPKSK